MSREINVKITATATNFSGAMNKVQQDTQKAVTSLKGIAPASQQVSQGLGQVQTAAVSGNKAINQFAAGSEQAQSKLGKFGKIFSDNRGIVFGVAGLTSALGEAVGMMGMYGDTAMRVEEAQNELNKLQQEGVTSGKAWSDAQAEVVKQQRFFNMVSRNTILSQMDMIFFTTMVISGLVKMSSEGGAASGMMGKLRNTFTGFKSVLTTTTNNFSSFMNAFSPLPATLNNTGAQMGKVTASSGQLANGINQVGVTSAISATRVIGFTAALAGIGLAAYGIYEVIKAAESMKDALDEVIAEGIMKISLFSAGILQLRVTLGLASEEEKKALADVNKMAGIVQQAYKELGLEGVKAHFLTAEEQQKVVDKIVEIINRTGESKDLLTEAYQEPISALQAYNTMQKGNLDLINAAKPHYFDFIKIMKLQGHSFEEAKERIDPWVDGMKLAGPVAEKLKDLLNLFYDTQINKAGEAAKEAEKMLDVLKELPSVQERVSGFMDQLVSGNKVAAGWYNEVTIAAGEWIAQNKNMIPVLEQQGTLNDQVIADLTDYFAQYMNVEQAKMMAAMASKVVIDMLRGESKGYKDVNKELFEQADILIDLLDEYNKVAAAATVYLNISKLTQTEMEGLLDVQDNIVGSLQTQAEEIQNTAKWWANLDGTGRNLINTNLDIVNTWAVTNDMLSTNEEWLLKVSLAQTQGAVAAKEWTQETMLGAQSSQTFRDNLYQLNDVLLKEMDTFNMTTAEIQDYIQFAYGGRDATIELARASQEARDSMVESFSGLFDADKFKDFKKEFKELDLRKVFGKDGAGDFRDMFADMREAAQDVEVLSTAMRALGVAVQDIDRMSGKDLAQNFDAFAEKYKETIVEAGLGNPIVDQMIERWEKLSGTDLRENLNKIPQTWMMINEAIKTNGISNTEANAIDIMRKKEMGEINKLSEDQIAIIEKAGYTYNRTTGEITKASDATRFFTEEMAKVEASAIVTDTIKEMWTDMAVVMIKQNVLLAGHWTLQMISVLLDAITTTEGVDSAFQGLVTTLNSSFVKTANKWETAMKNMVHNANAATSQTNSHFAALVKKLNSHFVKIANNFEKAMRNIAQNAKAAASQANSALASIKDRTVTIHYKETGAVPKSKGGIVSFADGGMISAASGLFTSNGPTRFGPYLFGDNSGGRETLAFLPHDGNKADSILDMLDAQFGRDRKGGVVIASGGDKMITVPIVININGEQYSFVRKYRIKQGQEVASQVGG